MPDFETEMNFLIFIHRFQGKDILILDLVKTNLEEFYYMTN